MPRNSSVAAYFWYDSSSANTGLPVTKPVLLSERSGQEGNELHSDRHSDNSQAYWVGGTVRRVAVPEAAPTGWESVAIAWLSRGSTRRCGSDLS